MSKELLIVNYHYFREESFKKGIYPITKKRFIEDIDLLSKRYSFVESDKVLDTKKTKSVILTFDDGLEEQMLAYEILKKKGIYALFFVSTMPYVESKALDVHKFHYLRTKINDIDLLNKLKSLSPLKDNISKNAILQYKYDDKEAATLKYVFNFLLDDINKKSFLDNMLSELLIEESDFIKTLYMSKDSLKKLIRTNSLGTHCHSHRPLSNLSKTKKKIEIKTSINYLNSLGGKISAISYPYGSKQAIDPDVFEICSKEKLEIGITMIRGKNYLNESLNKYSLKRISNSDLKSYI